MFNLGKYRKTVAALVTGNIGWAGIVIASPAPGVTASEWLALAIVEATALGVYTFANDNSPGQGVEE